MLLAIAGAARPAGAQPVDPQKLAAAQALFDQAQAAMDRSDWATACPKLEEVTRLLPNGVGGQLVLAKCYEGAGRLASAWTTYVLAQATAAQAHRSAEEAQARERAEALKPRLARIVIDVSDAARSLPGLSVERDGVAVGAAQWGTPVPVDRGKHVVTAAAAGKQRWEKIVEVTADGADVRVEVAGLVDAKTDLPPAPPPAPPVPPVADRPPIVAAPPPPIAPPPQPAPWWTGVRVGGAVLGGAGIVGIGVGAAAGAVAISKKNQSGPDCGASIHKTDPNACTPAGAQLRSSGLTAASISTGTFVGGAIALAGGVTLLAVGGAGPQAAKAQVGAGLRSIEVSGTW
jgi:hypothetical protein